jgi:hypothetical protein
LVPEDCWAVAPELLEINERAWSIWGLLNRQWLVAPMGGVFGWGGFPLAVELLKSGYGVSGEELLAEVQRLKVCENAQMEIEEKRRKLAEKKKGSSQSRFLHDNIEHVEGDLADFMDEEEDYGEEEFEE